MRFSTRAIHVGQEPEEVTGATIPPIFISSTYTQEAPNDHKGYDYSRAINPTRSNLEACLASLEGGEACAAFSSGLAATTAVFQTLRPGDGVVAGHDLYGGTFRLLDKIFVPWGLEVVYADGESTEDFEEGIVGMSKADEKKVDLDFPKGYYNKNLAGKKANFKIKLLNVYELKSPELNDDLAKSIGNFQTVADLRKHIEQNLANEADNAMLRQQEDELMQQLIASAKFGDMPEVLINTEVKKLMHEMQHTLSAQGISMEDHLKQLGKKESELALEFTPRALERVKASLVLRQVVHDEQLVVSEDEFKQELERLKKTYQDSQDMLKQIASPQHREYLGSSLLYKKVIDYLKSVMVDG